MSQKPETGLQRELRKWVTSVGGKSIKTHGNEFVELGTPDIIGVLPVFLSKTAQVFIVPFAFETKLVGEEATKIQSYRLVEWKSAGACAGSVSSLQEAKELIYEHVLRMSKNKFSASKVAWVV